MTEHKYTELYLNPGFTNWSEVNGGYGQAMQFVDEDTMEARLQGVVKWTGETNPARGTNLAVLDGFGFAEQNPLPEGFAPPRRHIFMVLASSGVVRFDLFPDGSIQYIEGNLPKDAWFSLNTIQWNFSELYLQKF